MPTIPDFKYAQDLGVLTKVADAIMADTLSS